MLLIKSQHLPEAIDLDELMQYSLSPVPHSLGIADDFFNKTNKVLGQMVAKKSFVFSTDSCHTDSITYIIEGQVKGKPVDFKLFLSKEENKLQLYQLLLWVWESKAAASQIDKCGTAVAVVEGKVYLLDTSDDDVSI